MPLRHAAWGFLLLVLPWSTVAQPVISTVAGSTYVFRGDGQPALNVPIGRVNLHVDRSGNLFAGDFDNSLIFKVNTSGILTVVGGNGIFGYSGDFGPALNAAFFGARSMATDSAGNLYVGDQYNYRVRKISPSGIVTPVAGNGTFGISGDNGPALNAMLQTVYCIVLDGSGNLLVATGNRIRKVNLTSGIITTIGGGGSANPGDGGPATAVNLQPRWLAVDSNGNIYVTEQGRNRIRRISPQGIISTVAGTGNAGFSGDGGSAISATLSGPLAAIPDSTGNFYILDGNNLRVRQVSPQGKITTVAGTGTMGLGGDGGPASAASFAAPRSIAVDASGAVYVADGLSFRVRKFVPGGVINTVAGNGQYRFGGDGGPATSAFLGNPVHAIPDLAGNLYITDTRNNRIRKVSADGTITTIAGTGDPGFSGDNGPATSGTLLFPSALAFDYTGILYIADQGNHRIRKISSSGIITTVAGNGTMGYGGDGGPAISASLDNPGGLAFDAAGNLYIGDQGNQRIRKVTPSGIISTYAGNGIEGFSGDGGPALSASLDWPVGLAFDASGSLYIADYYNSRVRKVTSGGIITTVAGNGLWDENTGLCLSNGDGGPATGAALCGVSYVAFDAAGNLYIADTENHKIRKVTNGIITTVAGDGYVDPTTGWGRYAGDGGPANSASFDEPTGVAVDSAGNLIIADFSNDRIRKVSVARPSFAVTPASLNFTGTDDSTTLPAQQISVSSTALGLGWTASASTSSGGNWLAVSPATGQVPGAVSVTPNVGRLAPGTYEGTVTIQAPLASPSMQTVSVKLTLQAGAPATLVLYSSSLNFSAQSGGGNPPVQTLRVGASGRGSVAWTASASTQSGANWLSASPASGTSTAATPASVQVSVNTAGLNPGVYSGSLQIATSSATQPPAVGVTLVVTRVTSTILVSQTGLLFTGVLDGSVVPSQSFGVLNVGQGTMNWTIEAGTLSGGNWLAVTPSNGSSTANSLQIPMVEVQVNSSGMSSGQYSGWIRVRAAGADNSPQTMSVDLNVLPRGSNPGVLVRPTGLIFTAQVGASSPSSQATRLATPVPGSVEVRGGLMTFDGASWLTASPRTFSVAPADQRTITIQPSLGSLTPGVYRGALTLLFGDGSPAQTVNILFVVVAQAAAAANIVNGSGTAAEVTCVPQRLLAVMRSLGGSFSSSVSWPTTLEVQVADDCGNAVPRATVVASFSNGDSPLMLASLGNGLYTGSWRPLNAASLVSLAIRALAPPLADAQLQAQGAVGANPNPKAPAVYPGGVVNAASFSKDNTVAPGSIISIFGKNMAAAQPAGADCLPLPTNLAGATLNIAGMDVPLFYSSSGQLNAQLPYELTSNSRHQVVVRARASDGSSEFLTVPETVTVSDARPGIFTVNQQGTGQGAILNGAGVLVDANAPIAAGGVVQIYATGMGMTSPAVPSGRPAPSAEPLARLLMPAQVRIGGKTAEVQYAGLAPGFVGLYQVNAVVPAGLTPGNSVSLVLIQNGVSSNTVTLAVK